MGKWGGRELGLRSDLDFIFVSVNDASTVAQKTAKRFLSRMTEPHKGGSIYSVDMRLRPSGHAGPILVSVAQLQEHLMTKAAAWERQSYLRARPLISLTINPAQTACVRGLSKEDRAELLMIRQKLFVQSPLSGAVDLKLEYGGLAAIEFAAQIALLSRREFSLDPSTQGMIHYLQGVDSRWRETGPMLLEKYEFLRTIEQLQQLTTSQSGSKLQMKSDSFKRLALILGSQVSALEQKLRNLFSETTLALNQVNDLGEK